MAQPRRPAKQRQAPNRRRAVVAELRRLIDAYGLTEQEVFPEWFRPAQPVRKEPVQYMDPKTGHTWSGRGTPPAWLAGKDWEIYRVYAGAGTVSLYLTELPHRRRH